MQNKIVCLDFETLPIEQRPDYPPVPVSFSLQLPEWRAPRFYAWAHKSGGNNCSKADAAKVLKEAYARIDSQTAILAHNAKFDLDVAEAHFGLRLPPWSSFHDTMFLLFLEDPHQRELGLKPSSERLLGMPPEERDAVASWLLESKKQLEADFPEIVSRYGDLDKKTGRRSGIKPSSAGKYVAYAPGTVVGPYANGDVTRTLKLFKLLHERVLSRGMGPAYDRERKIMPIFLRNEREGIRIDEEKLFIDQITLDKAQTRVDDWLRKALKAPSLDLNKDAEVAKALDASGQVQEWTLTKTGKNSTSKKNMKLSHFKDQKVAAAYSYRQKIATMLETFIEPWQRHSRNGWLHTTWNQVRQIRGNDTGGTRTGRPSSDTPNFLNMPKAVQEGGIGGYIYPAHIRDLPHPPRIRSYILPDEADHWIGRRDFAQQELRILAHFEDGLLLQAYLEDPRLDVHEFARQAIQDLMGIDVGRGATKTINFGYIYGQGVPSLAAKMEKSVEETKQIRNAQMNALPGLAKLSKSLKARAREGQPIHTWGGREYYVEEPREIDGQWRTFDYKLLNYLIQGSAADITKESIIRYEEVRRDARFMLTVYDENNISGPKKALPAEMLRLREAMMSIELDVPLLSDGEWGPDLGRLEALKEPTYDLSKWGMKW